MLRALVALQADILHIQSLDGIKHHARREDPMLFMLKLRVALPAQANAQLGTLVDGRALEIGRAVDVLVLPAERDAGRHRR